MKFLVFKFILLFHRIVKDYSEKNISAILPSKYALIRIIQSKSYYFRNQLKEGWRKYFLYKMTVQCPRKEHSTIVLHVKWTLSTCNERHAVFAWRILKKFYELQVCSNPEFLLCFMLLSLKIIVLSVIYQILEEKIFYFSNFAKARYINVINFCALLRSW